MNVGRKKCLEEKAPLTNDKPSYPPATYQAKQPDAAIRAKRDQIFAVLDKRSPAHLVDVRSVDEFTGKIIAPPGMAETAQRGRHIPGPQHNPWSKAVKQHGTCKYHEA